MDKKIFPIATLVWPYLSGLFIAIMGENLIWGYLWMIFNFAMVIVSIVGAKMLRKSEEYKSEDILKWNMIIKCAQIPFFLFFALLMYGLYVIAANPEFAIIDYAGSILGMLIGLCYIIVLSTSAYSFNGLKKANKEGKIKLGIRLIFGLLSLVICLDVPTSIIEYIVVKRKANLAK